MSNNLTIFRDGEGILHGHLKGNTFPLEIIQGNMFKVRDKDFDGKIISKTPEFEYYEIPTRDGFRTFIYVSPSITQVVSSPGGRRGISGINIQDEDVQFPGTFNTLNFEGASVVVVNDGAGKATIIIGGGSMITGGGTVNRLAMFTPDGSTIGNSPLLRSGSDVIADAFMYFNSGFGIDVVASGGADILNIGAANADVINYGYAGTTHNMNGTVFNVFTTNLNVTDKIITLNDGGAAGSGGNVGFEIEEGGVATGYFIQNTTRDGFDFQASGVTGVATFDLSLLTGNQTATLQDASGTLAYLSDIPAPVDAWLLDGNTVVSEKWIGTIDNFDFPFRTNNVENMVLTKDGRLGIGFTPTNAHLQVAYTYGASALGLKITSNIPQLFFDQTSIGGNNRSYSFLSNFNSAGLFEFLYGTVGSQPTSTAWSFFGASNQHAFGSLADAPGSAMVRINGNAIIGNSLFASTAPTDGLLVGGNVGIGTATFGTDATNTLAILNGATPPSTSPANSIQIYSVDTDDATASLGIRTEQAVVVEAVISDRTLKVTINGTVYKICLKA